MAIVRALAMRPRLMLLDEVTSALDPELVAEVLDVIRELAASGMTMLIATHEMGFARDIANRVCFLSGGRIVEQGPPGSCSAAPEMSAPSGSCGESPTRDAFSSPQPFITQPPSTTSSCPVMKDVSGAARNSAALAMSAGVPRRLTACCSRMNAL